MLVFFELEIKNLNKWINHQTIGVFSILLVLAGLLFSEAAMSIGMIGLAVNAVFNKNIGRNFHTFVQNRVLLGFTAIFFIVLVSGLWSENLDWLSNRLQMKLPFLLLPFAIVALPRFDKSVFFPVLAGFFWVVSAVCVYSVGIYVLDFETTNEAYKQGHVLFTPVMHIRFSLIVAICVAIGWYLYQEKYYIRFPAERLMMLMITILLIAYLHVLAVRTGLVSLYGALGFFVLHYILKTKRYALGIGLGGLIILGLALAIRFVPTLWNKVGYMLWSLEQIEQGERLADLSDSYRVATIQAGMHLGNQHPILGTGWGDIKDETATYLQSKYPELLQAIYMPQSEYVLFYGASGLLGLLIFIFVTLQPLFYNNAWQNLFIGAFHIIMILSFIVEQTLETQLGVAIYTIFSVMSARFITKGDHEAMNP